MSNRNPAGFRLNFAPLRRRRRLMEPEVSQRRLAEAVGVHTFTIGRIERNETVPNLRLVVAIARALGTPVHQLYEVVETDDRAA